MNVFLSLIIAFSLYFFGMFALDLFILKGTYEAKKTSYSLIERSISLSNCDGLNVPKRTHSICSGNFISSSGSLNKCFLQSQLGTTTELIDAAPQSNIFFIDLINKDAKEVLCKRFLFFNFLLGKPMLNL